MRRSLLAATLIFPLSALAATALAAGPDAWHGPHHPDAYARELHEISLTDAQRTQIKSIVTAAREQAKPEHEALRQQRDAFEQATPGTAAYQTAAAALAQAESQAASSRVSEKANVRAQIWALLTPEQQTQLASLEAQHLQRVEQMRQQHEQSKPATNS